MNHLFLNQMKQIGVSKKSKLLLALSGGVDSMVLCHLLISNNFKFSIAHCNFLLRGNESDSDEDFIRSYTDSNKIEAFFKKFKTKEYASENKISIQMAARDLRYQWFLTLKEKNNFDFILTAHHLDDSVETFLINLIRGTGIKGLHGIQDRNFFIRPLICVSKKDILEYVQIHNIIYRDDSSNKDLKYVRNKIRNEIIPLMKDINPNVRDAIIKTISRIKDVEGIYNKYIIDKKKELIKVSQSQYKINIPKILSETFSKQLLFEIISDFGFFDVDSVFQSFFSSSGKEFFNSDYYMIKDRSDLIITEHITNNTIIINKKTNKIVSEGVSFAIKKIDVNDSVNQDNENKMLIDFDKLDFPLLIRPWQSGDRFKPLGMKGFKKLSDYFIDNKFSLIEKKKVRLLISNQNIVCILGERLDERFKLVQESKKVYIVTIL